MTNRFNDIIALRSELERKIQSFGKDAFTEEFAPFFAANPQVDGVLWSQYTPYFNDGDECVFGVNDPSLILSVDAAKSICTDENADFSDAGTEDERFGWDNPRCVKSWSLSKTPFNLDQIGFSTLWKGIPEEVFRSVFGDHVEVRVMRNGEVFIEDCEHD